MMLFDNLVANIRPFCKVLLNTVILRPETFTVNDLQLAVVDQFCCNVILVLIILPIGNGVQLVMVFVKMDGG